MEITHVITIAAISLTSFLPASCHKMAPVKPAAPVSLSATDTNGVAHNLGEVALTNHSERIVALGGGKNCIFTPKILGGRDVQITLALESKTAAGKVSDLSVTEVTAKDGKAFDAVIGDFKFSFTPVVSEDNSDASRR